MTVKSSNRDAIAHGKTNVRLLREQPKYPSWALKPTMAITGVLFGFFIIVHMLGNLKVFAGKKDFNTYAIFPRVVSASAVPNEDVPWIPRIVLLVAIMPHIFGGLILAAHAKQFHSKFRRQGMMSSWNTSTARSMIITDIVLLASIIFRLLDLTTGIGVVPSVFKHGEAYQDVVASFSRLGVVVWYIIAQLALLLRLSHDLWTATPDLSITGRRWRKALLFLSGLLPSLAVVGNTFIPVVALTGLVSQVEEEIYHD